MVPKNKIH